MTVTLVLVLLTSTAPGFLLDDNQCVTSARCQCNKNIIFCTNGGLTQFPVFDMSAYKSSTEDHFLIAIERNNISSIPRHAFENVTYINSSSITLYLRFNNISRVDPLAFSGIENRTVALYLNNNKLTSLPSAIALLSRLNTLDLQGNQLSTLDPTVLSSIGRSLTSLLMDMDHFKTWPVAMSKLNVLFHLEIYHIPFFDLPQTAFKTFTHLNFLVISHSILTRIPTTICYLHNIDTLILANGNFTSNSVFTQCSNSISARSLTLENLGIKEFPGVLHTFDYLKILEFDNNEISHIPTDAIPTGHGLTRLNLRKNHLTSIPSAISKLKNLMALDISFNNLATIENHALTYLPTFGELQINSNPIQYIAPHAFDDINSTFPLGISLRNITLHLIPEAVVNQHRIRFSFADNDIVCSCRMAYLKGWDPGDTRGLDEPCANRKTETIKHYILNDLRNCPGNVTAIVG